MQDMRKFLNTKPIFWDIKWVYYIIITVGKVSSHKNFENLAVGRRAQAYYFIIKETPAQEEICKI